MNNVTGWNELFNGNVVTAAYTMFNESLNGWFLSILFFVMLGAIFLKTKSVGAVSVAGLLFLGIYVSVLKAVTMPIIFMILGFALAVLIFRWYRNR